MAGLKARFIERVPSLEGVQADLLLIEPNGDSCRVRCLCRPDGTTEIQGQNDLVSYLNEKYGDRTVCSLSRQITLSFST